MDGLKNRGGRGRRRTDITIEDEVVELLEERKTPTQIHRHFLPTHGVNAPSVRTVHRIKKRRLADDPSAKWMLEEATDPYELSLVPPVLAVLIEHTGGQKCHLTRLEAQWITKIRLVAPDLRLWQAYRLAHLYMVRVHRGEPTADLDELLAFAPWRGREQFDRFFRMVLRAHPDWAQISFHIPAEHATPEEMATALLGSFRLSIAEGVFLAMEMRKGMKEADNEQASE